MSREFVWESRYEVDANGCWIWRGRSGWKGYGRLTVKGKTVAAHRMSWLLLRGDIPAGLHVLHRCDVPPCINPDHLYLGTNADNVRDREARGRGVVPVRVKRPEPVCVDCSATLGKNAGKKRTKRCHPCAGKHMWASLSDDDPTRGARLIEARDMKHATSLGG